MVSILIPNYNYGKYLSTCFESVLNQTYNDIEIVFSDNASTDNSLEIVSEYMDKFTKRGYKFSLIKQKVNIGAVKNAYSCYDKCNGDYVYFLSSDDIIEPDFIKRSVNVFDNNNVSLVITNRNEFTDDEMSSLVPFYNKDCIIDGEEQSAVFMMSGVCVLGQMIFRHSSFEMIKEFRTELLYCGDWQIGFLLSLVGDVCYISDALFDYRLHSGSQAHILMDNLVAPFELYIMLYFFVESANKFGKHLPQGRYEASIKKLGSLCLRFSLKYIYERNNELSEKYLLLAKLFDNSIVHLNEYKEVKKALENNCYDKTDELYSMCYKRRISYDPPKSHMDIDKNGKIIDKNK